MKQYKEKYKFNDKLNDEKDFPKIKMIPKNLHKAWGQGKFVLPSPLEVNALMKKSAKGETDYY